MKKMLLAALLAALLPATAPAFADTVYTNANGYTLGSKGELQRFAALVVGDDGKVKSTLKAGATLPAGATVDMNGATLWPGLIDAHGHVMRLGELKLLVDLRDSASIPEALGRIKAGLPATGWVLGLGWNQERWFDGGKLIGRFPTAAELDSVTGERPAFFSRVDGHAGWANSAALKAAGITRATQAPAGGEIIRDADGNPTGVFVDKAMALITGVIPRDDEKRLDLVLEKSLETMAEIGMTGAHDAGMDKRTWDRYVRFAKAGKMTARIYAMAAGPDNRKAIAPSGPIPWSFDDRLAMQSMKLVSDGALGSRGAYLIAPYSDMPGTRGLDITPADRLKTYITDASRDGFQVNVHAIGDAANRSTMDGFAAVPAAERSKLRHRNEHAQIVDMADLGRFASLQIIASMQPTHATSDKGMAEARLGEARLGGAYAWAQIKQSGAQLALGSDFPVEPPDPMFGIHAAVTRQSRDGLPTGGWRPWEKLSREDAFAGFTLWAARAGHAEAKVGTLEPGKWADFITLERDPFTAPEGDLWKIKVTATWLAGKQVFKR
ncbi:amidohydrolase [Sandarakinorhabdus sp.]|uniref:amidohydrolase n=1 Tax=Sandarakinorhabdus sp. TaxID=1916663 RepID=UPI0033408F35